MSVVRIILAILLAIVLQATLADHLGFFGISPDITVLLLVLVALRRGPITGTLVGFALGLVQDALVPETLGMNMLAKSVLGFAMGQLSNKLVLAGPPMIAALIGGAVLLHDLIFFLAWTRLDLPRFAKTFVVEALPDACFTVVVGIAFLLLAGALGLNPLRERSHGR